MKKIIAESVIFASIVRFVFDSLSARFERLLYSRRCAIGKKHTHKSGLAPTPTLNRPH